MRLDPVVDPHSRVVFICFSSTFLNLCALIFEMFERLTEVSNSDHQPRKRDFCDLDLNKAQVSLVVLQVLKHTRLGLTFTGTTREMQTAMRKFPQTLMVICSLPVADRSAVLQRMCSQVHLEPCDADAQLHIQPQSLPQFKAVVF